MLFKTERNNAWINYQRVCARERVKKREARFYMAQDTLDLIGMPEYKLKGLLMTNFKVMIILLIN